MTVLLPTEVWGVGFLLLCAALAAMPPVDHDRH